MVASGQYYHAEAGGTDVESQSKFLLRATSVFSASLWCVFAASFSPQRHREHSGCTEKSFSDPRVVLTGHHSEDESFNFRNVRPERKNCTRRCAVARSFA